MGEINSKMQMSEETIENLVNSFRKLREVLLAGRKYVTVIRFELIRMHEIQSNLRQLSYFDVRGRLRLTLQLARVTLNLPMVVDIAMREDDADSDDEDDHRGGGHSSARSRDSARRREKTRVKLGRVKGRTKRGLIPPRVGAVIGLAIGALEMGERVL
ncbi:hypothetical protein FRC03_000583 [Tulasnella sp. 419]|nr:hypothetical protein FRC03_000583 [Tulasnella sp. 419]